MIVLLTNNPSFKISTRAFGSIYINFLVKECLIYEVGKYAYVQRNGRDSEHMPWPKIFLLKGWCAVTSGMTQEGVTAHTVDMRLWKGACVVYQQQITCSVLFTT